MTGESIKNSRQHLKSHNEKLSKHQIQAQETPEIQRNPPSDNIRKQSQKDSLPIPKGDTPYALAKNAEYKNRDLDKAEHYYKLAIRNGERIESAVKDLASLLHQRGKTQEACDFLKQYKYLFKQDSEKYENLYKTLEKQLIVSGNSQNKSLKISGISSGASAENIRSLFENPVRIRSFEFGSETIESKISHFCIIKFNSHSSARKTLEGFHSWDRYKVEWISIHGELAGDAHYARQKMEEYRRYHPTFDYTIFERDPQGYVFCLPLDNTNLGANKQNTEQESEIKDLIGAGLFKAIFQ